MNFTESFSEFSSRLGPTDLALYAGVGLVLWVLFKDKLSPVQKLILDLVNKVKGTVKNKTTTTPVVTDGVYSDSKDDRDVFFDLVVSWKQTRDLAVRSGCAEAVKVADQMFPFLSPNVCSKEEKEVK
jgi:imidazolonepropionase-like amidohydrolase